jgi:hypothetical protein
MSQIGLANSGLCIACCGMFGYEHFLNFNTNFQFTKDLKSQFIEMSYFNEHIL